MKKYNNYLVMFDTHRSYHKTIITLNFLKRQFINPIDSLFPWRLPTLKRRPRHAPMILSYFAKFRDSSSSNGHFRNISRKLSRNGAPECTLTTPYRYREWGRRIRSTGPADLPVPSAGQHESISCRHRTRLYRTQSRPDTFQAE